jgi:hypothetical protein
VVRIGASRAQLPVHSMPTTAARHVDHVSGMTTIAARRLQAVSTPAIAAMALVLSAWFAARAVVSWTMGEVAPTSAAAAVRPAAPPAPAVVAKPARDGAAFVTRNMFCSSCKPAGDGDGTAPSGAGAQHALPRLIATHVGVKAGEGWATMEVAGLAGGFINGATLPGGGVIESIERGAIIVRFSDGPVRVPLASDVVTTAKDPAKPADTAANDDPWANRIRAVGENRWEVDRTLIKELVQSGTGGGAAAKGVRLQPVNKDGKLAGVRVVAARSGSLAQKLGLASGDVIDSIDGQAIDSPQALMGMYNKLDDLRRVDLGVKRKGANVTLTYDLP